MLRTKKKVATLKKSFEDECAYCWHTRYDHEQKRIPTDTCPYGFDEQ